VVVGARNELRSTLLISHPSNPTPNLYVDLVALSSTRLKSYSIIFSLKFFFLKTCSQISNLLLQLSVLFDSMEKLTLERATCIARWGQNIVARRMIKFLLKIFNLNGISLQIRSKQGTSGANTKQRGTSFKLSEFQPGMIKQTCSMRMHEPQTHISNHDHFAVVTWFGTHIIVHGSKRSNFRKETFKFKIKLLVLTKNLAK
jgi:hypothetical protein